MGGKEPWFTGSGTMADPYLRTGYAGPVLYDLHVLGTPTEPEERYEFDDPAKAVIGYNRLACERRRRAVLSKSGHLPNMEAEIVDAYVPSPDAPPIHSHSTQSWATLSGTPIEVTLGQPQPAFPREQVAREETEAERNLREDAESRAHAARWYALGYIDALGGLSVFDEADAEEFSQWHVETSTAEHGYNPITEQWATWSARRREEIGR